MYRQPYHISRGVRITIMLSLISAFLISAPLLIAYTSGYRYSFDEGLISKGSLSVTAKPIDATIFVNNIAIDQEGGLENRDKAAISMDTLAAGMYDVRIERDGYLPFEKTIDVRSNEASYVRDLTLFIDTQFEQVEDVSSYDYVQLTKQAPALLLQEGATWHTKLPGQGASHRQGKFADPVILHTHPSLQAAVLLDTSNAPSSTRAVVAGFNGLQPTAYTIPTALTDTADVHWSGNSDTLYVRASSTVYAISHDSFTQVGVTTATEWFVDVNNVLWEQQERTLVQTKDKETTRFLPSTTVQPIDVNEARVILQGAKSVYVSLHTASEQITQIPTQGLLFDADKNLWYTWSEFEVFSIDGNGTIKPLYRSSQEIHDIAILDEYGVIGIASANGVSAFHTRYLTSHTLISGQSVSMISADIAGRVLYAIEENAEQGTKSLIKRRY
ncbi:MAG: PEGA domain-containing protein [Candidatus Magasanikbacteria bacterium]|nr:PEGA domain-containing protein [Candidatus Magasanikbacteria bacterium]